MIGNDVVDLADPETQASQLNPRFDQRILSDQEQRRFVRCSDPHRLRWTLWAAKEASYKRGCKLFPDLVFSPRRFETQPLNNGDIRVSHSRLSSTVQITQQGHYVHALAQPDRAHNADTVPERSHLTIALCELPVAPEMNPSQQIRRYAQAHLAAHLQIDAAELQIITRHKIPYLIGPDQQILGDLSFSHHGRFLALAFQPFCAKKH